MNRLCVFIVAAVLWLAMSNPPMAHDSAGASSPHGPDAAGSGYRGGVVTPPLPKPKFTLTDTSGAPFDFWSNTEGYVTLLFFGYTHCPDECPLHMHNLSVALAGLPATVAGQIRVVFVTTDPARDSAEALRSWLDNFDRRFIGLTGSQAAVEAAQRAAGLPPGKRLALANGNYGIGHAGFVLAYSKDDRAHLIYPSGITVEDWDHDLPLLAAETWSER